MSNECLRIGDPVKMTKDDEKQLKTEDKSCIVDLVHIDPDPDPNLNYVLFPNLFFSV